MAKEQSEIVLQKGPSIEIAFCVQGGTVAPSHTAAKTNE